MKLTVDIDIKTFAIKIFFLLLRLIQLIGILAYWLILITLPFYLLLKWNFNQANYLLEFFKYSLWPFVALTFIFVFKENLGKLIDEITELSFWGTKTVRGPLPQQKDNKEIHNEELFDEYKKLYEELKGHSDDLVKTNKELEKELINARIELDFEKIYASIFGSQLNLLEILVKLNKINVDVMNIYYSSVQKSHPALSDWGLNDYLKYLIISGLIQLTNDGIEITFKGTVFLRYLKEYRGYVFNKAN